MRGRRAFLRGAGSGAAGLLASGWPVPARAETCGLPREPASGGTPDPVPLLPDLRQRFLFEYYPWYAVDPWRHWEQWDRTPPLDIASRYVPRLGAYDSRSVGVIESHARSIADSGAGGVSLSWWGAGSFEDAATPLLMDVLRAHGLKLAFHLEPYAPDHGLRWAADILYLLREYGEKRRWDALLLLAQADGSVAPVFKGFRTIVPPQVTDCHGVVRPVPDYLSDAAWRRQNLGLRRLLEADFPRLTLLADTLDVERAQASAFDGIAIYDNFVPPEDYAGHARQASQRGLLFSFNVNPGYDGIEPRRLAPDSCAQPLPFAPEAGPIDWRRPEERERAALASRARIRDSLAATLAAQADPGLENARRGFFLAYLNSFNEWHEGHAFEPMLDASALPPEQAALGYHNPADGGYRLAALKAALAPVLACRAAPGRP